MGEWKENGKFFSRDVKQRFPFNNTKYSDLFSDFVPQCLCACKQNIPKKSFAKLRGIKNGANVFVLQIYKIKRGCKDKKRTEISIIKINFMLQLYLHKLNSAISLFAVLMSCEHATVFLVSGFNCCSFLSLINHRSKSIRRQTINRKIKLMSCIFNCTPSHAFLMSW